MAYDKINDVYFARVYFRNKPDYDYVVNRIKSLQIYNKANGQPNVSLALADLGRHGKFEQHLRVEITQQVQHVQPPIKKT